MKLRVVLLTAMLLSFVLGANNAAAKPAVMPIKTAVTARSATQVAANAADAITIPQMLSYQGKLLDASGNPVPDTTYSVVFRLYTVASGGSSFWNETQTVRTKAGLFSVLLGSVTPVESIPQAGTCYLGMKVGSDPEMTPRLQIASAAYTFLAHKADTANYAVGIGAADSARIAASSYNSAKLQGKDTTGFVCAGQANSITSPMIVDGTITRGDVASNFKAPDADSADYARNAPGSVDSARIAANAWNAYKLEGKDTTALDARYVNEGQSAGGDLTGTYPNPTIGAGKVDSSRLAAGAVTMPKIHRAGATVGQVIKWTGSAWAPRNDSIGSDNDWVRVGGDSVLYTIRPLGVARGGAGNVLYGTYNYTHTNLGSHSTTGTSGQDYAYCTVSGGLGDTASGAAATVGGGVLNQAGDYATVGGGCGNIASNAGATVAGGDSNHALYPYATAGGGRYNEALAIGATVGGGQGNDAGRDYATVGGGQRNNAIWNHTTVGGGLGNCADNPYSTVSGGDSNLADGQWAFVGGGCSDTAVFDYCGALSGYHNVAGSGVADSCAVVAGGRGNTAIGHYATVGGGKLNSADSVGATVPGGEYDTVFGKYGFATGLHSVVRSADTNSVALNGTITSASRQTRVFSLTQGLGALSIDHPLDPQSRVLNQYTVASSEMVLFYRGAATIGDDGRVTVELPGYFDALCRNPMVQLTGVGTYEVFVAENVSNNCFVIGGKPGTQVFWTVTGERKDAVAEEGRASLPVEQTKTGSLVGHSVNGAW